MASGRAIAALYMRRGGATYREIGSCLGVGAARARQLAASAHRAEARLNVTKNGSNEAGADLKLQDVAHALQTAVRASRPNLGTSALSSSLDVIARIHEACEAKSSSERSAQLTSLRGEYMLAYVSWRLAKESGEGAASS